MSGQRVSVDLLPGAVYVYGTVNGEETVWTNTEGNTWQTTAPRSGDDTYRLALKVYQGDGKYYEASATLYYGVLNLIFDRTQADVARVEYLASVGLDRMTEAELQEWVDGMRGAYNATDLNRVGSAVNYIAERFRQYGYQVPVSPRMDWKISDIPTREQMTAYLDDVSVLRGALAVLPATPRVPPDMEELTWQEANDIERILWDINALINNMIASFLYCGTVQCGDWAASRR